MKTLYNTLRYNSILKNKGLSYTKKLIHTTTDFDYIPKTAIGVSEFRKLVFNSTVFVDKSLLIKEFIEDPGETLLMTFPRRWGKTINLDMMKTFFGLQVDEYGNQLPLVKYDSYKIFGGGEIDLGFGNTRKLNPLKIARDEAIMKQQGQYPVVHIDFKNTKGNSYEEVLNKVKTELRKAYSSHEYLTKSSHLREDEHRIFNKYLNFIDHQQLTNDEVAQGLYTLNYLLYKHFGKNSIILMDEYDAPINNAYMGGLTKDADLITGLFRDINETTFKSNKHLEKGLITGVFRIAKANLFSGLNNLVEYNILDTKFSPYYGFTQEEVEYLLTQYQVPKYLAEDIKNWYNGYMLRDYQIYNPWSIVKCLSKFQENRDIQDLTGLRTTVLQSYWEDSGNIDFVKPLFNLPIIKNKIDQLLRDEPLVFNLKKQVSSSDYQILKKVIDLGSNYAINESVADLLFSYLFAAGYLTGGNEAHEFRLPNNEIKVEFQYKMLEHYKQQYNIDTNLFTDVTDQLQKVLDSKKDQIKTKVAMQGIDKAIVRLLEEFPEFAKLKDDNIASPMAKIVHANEDLIHSVMSYIALQLKSLSKFGTEVYLGKGRADIILIDEGNNKAVVIELKYGSETAQDAIEQIKDKDYAKGLVETETLDVVLMGISVTKNRKIDIAYEEVFKDKNFSGNGNEVDNSYDLPYSEWFNKYYSEGIEKILSLRIKDLDSELREKVKILSAKYQLSTIDTEVNKVVQDIQRLEIKNDDIILIPYNIENKHWVGMVFKKVNEGFEVVYFNPENKEVELRLLSDLERELKIIGQKLSFHQELVEEQQYNNCGAEVIENFIYYITGKRIEGDKAVIYHSYLVETELIATNKIFEEETILDDSYQTLIDSQGIITVSGDCPDFIT